MVSISDIQPENTDFVGFFISDNPEGATIKAKAVQGAGIYLASEFKPTAKTFAVFNPDLTFAGFVQAADKKEVPQLVIDILNIENAVISETEGFARTFMVFKVRGEFAERITRPPITEAEIPSVAEQITQAAQQAQVPLEATPPAVPAEITGALPGNPSPETVSRFRPVVDSFEAEGKRWFSILQGRNRTTAADVLSLARLGKTFVLDVVDPENGLVYAWYFEPAGIILTTPQEIVTPPAPSVGSADAFFDAAVLGRLVRITGLDRLSQTTGTFTGPVIGRSAETGGKIITLRDATGTSREMNVLFASAFEIL